MKGRKRRVLCARKSKRRKFIRAAVRKAVAREVEISWSDYYPMCPACGSWEVEKTPGKVWNYCPECGQRIKNVETDFAKKEGVNRDG